MNILSEYLEHSEGEEKLKMRRIEEVNELLRLNEFDELGNLLDNSSISVGKTVRTVKSLLEDRNFLVQEKREYLLESNRLNKEVLMANAQNNQLNRKIKELEGKIRGFKGKIELVEKEKVEIEKRISKEKEENARLTSVFQKKENGWKHEINKKEQAIEELRDRIKAEMEKNSCGNCKREVILTEKKALNKGNNAEEVRKFYELLCSGYEMREKSILEENVLLRATLDSTYGQLENILEMKAKMIGETFKNSVLAKEVLNISLSDSEHSVREGLDYLLESLKDSLLGEDYKIADFSTIELEKGGFKTQLSSVKNSKRIAELGSIADQIEKSNPLCLTKEYFRQYRAKDMLPDNREREELPKDIEIGEAEQLESTCAEIEEQTEMIERKLNKIMDSLV